jgi:prefoldin subunit 5
MGEDIASITDMERKLEEYARFVRDVLRPDYQICRNLEGDIRDEINAYSDLMIRITNELINKNYDDSDDSKQLIMDVDLGHNKVSCRAKIDVTSTTSSEHQNVIFVHVGMGFHVEYTWDEALIYIQKRIEYLNQIKLPHQMKKLKHVLSHIQSSERILDELSQELVRNQSTGSCS